MKKDYAPDFGLYVLKQRGKTGKHIFLPFAIFHIARVDDKLYCTTSDKQFGDTFYAVTIDFPEDTYHKLLKLIPDNIANSLKQIFKGEFRDPQMVKLPFPINVGVEARLGELTTSKKEQYVPFVATKVFKIE